MLSTNTRTQTEGHRNSEKVQYLRKSYRRIDRQSTH